MNIKSNIQILELTWNIQAPIFYTIYLSTGNNKLMIYKINRNKMYKISNKTKI